MRIINLRTKVLRNMGKKIKALKENRKFYVSIISLKFIARHNLFA